jgi:hypothetical protein
VSVDSTEFCVQLNLDGLHKIIGLYRRRPGLALSCLINVRGAVPRMRIVVTIGVFDAVFLMHAMKKRNECTDVFINGESPRS